MNTHVATIPSESSSAARRPLSHRIVLPLALVIVVCGIAAPFIISSIKRTQLAANETATVTMIRAYISAQHQHRANGGRGGQGGGDGEYARQFDQLSLPAKFPDMDDPKAAPLNGYRFRILTNSSENEWSDKDGRLTGGVGLLAVPAQYMITGRDTFLVSDSSIYLIDLDVRTAELTRELRTFTAPPRAQKLGDE